jgi:uncharacterized caspase-like protein
MLFQHGYALIVGVGRSAYPAWSLPTTASDAAALRAALTDPSLCAYPADDDHVRLLCDEGATRAALRDGLAWLARQAAADGDVTALVYISSHGWIDKATGRYYLLPHDVKPFDVPGSALAGEELAAALRAIDAPRLLVFVDSCHAAGMATAKDGDVLELPGQFGQTALPKGLADALRAGQGRAVFASSRGEQRSWLRPDRTLSLYTHHLLEGLHGAGSRPGDDVVRLSHLAAHLSRTVPDSARRLCAAEQTPFYDWSTEDFPVALLAGGKGLPAGGWQAGESLAQPPAAPTYTATLSGSGAIAQDNSVAAGAGGIAIGRVGRE